MVMYEFLLCVLIKNFFKIPTHLQGDFFVVIHNLWFDMSQLILNGGSNIGYTSM